MNGKSRSKKVSSPEYRVFIGKELRDLRISKGLTLSDIREMTEIPINTIISLEKGNVVNIDYYVEYAKSVEYQLPTLAQANIDSVPKNELSKESSERIRLTILIRNHILKNGFLLKNRTSRQIMEELERIKVIPKNSVSTTEISGVMRNLISDEVVKKGEKINKKDSYIQNKILNNL